MNNTLVKGLRLLEALTRRSRAMGVTELAAASGMPKSGAHRLLQALVDEGYVSRRDPGLYSASVKLWELGSSALLGFDLRRHAGPMMEELMETTGESVHLSVLDDMEVVYIHKVDSLRPVRAYSQIGGRAPAHCVATGKAMMAFKSESWLNQALRLLAATNVLTDPDAFLVEVEQIRNCGYAVNRGGWRAQVNGLAAPIIDDSCSVIAAIGISGHESGLNLQRLESLAQPVLGAAHTLSCELTSAAPHAALHHVTHRWIGPLPRKMAAGHATPHRRPAF